MERAPRRQERDVNDLLTSGFFRTARARSPSPYSYSTPPLLDDDAPDFLRTSTRNVGRARSRSRVSRRGPPPPRPIVEDEAVSIAKEVSPRRIPSHDPPCRGTIEQYPIILESDVSDHEAQRLHAEPRPKEPKVPKVPDDNSERRFVLVPDKTSTSKPSTQQSQPKSRPEHVAGEQENPKPIKVENAKNRNNNEPALKPPPLERKRSRQDLPNLQTKVPREIPPQYRRSASGLGTRDRDDISKGQTTPNTSTSEYFLSPDTLHTPRPQSKDSSTSAPQFTSRHYQSQESKRGTSSAENRKRSGSVHTHSSRSETPLSEKRNGSAAEPPRRPRRNTNEKMARPQQVATEDSRRTERHRSSQSDRGSGSERARSPRRSTTSNLQYYSSSEDDPADSGSEKNLGRTLQQRRKDLRPDNDYERSMDLRSNKSTLSSRFSSPLPSPKMSPNQPPRTEPFDRSDTFPQSRRPSSRPISPLTASQETPRANRLNPMSPGLPQRPRSSSRVTNAPTPIPMPAMPPMPDPISYSPLPVPVPTRIDLHSPGDTRRTPAVPQYEDERPPSMLSPVKDKPYWQPPPFRPSTLDKPVGSYRRFSEDIERGSVAPLPACPRIQPTLGRQDWLTLPQCPDFDICPTCFHSIIAPTVFRDHFIPAPQRSVPIVCDFGASPWYRIAWLLTLKERRKELGLFYGLANVALLEDSCPGKRDAIRSWSSILDPKAGDLIKNFDVCSHCVKSVETLLPSLRGTFIRTDSGYSNGSSRICDLRFDSKRFVQYFDALETTADDAAYHDAAPDTRTLAKLAKKFSRLEECQQSTDLPNRRWYTITQLPDFTVCEECYDDVVLPEYEDRKPIALMFNQTPQRIPRASCQLYSDRMRTIFERAVNTDDYKLLATKARERKNAENEWKTNVAVTKRQSRESIVGSSGLARELQRLEEEWRTRWE